MNKTEIADILITSSSEGAIPVFLDIDEEKIELDLKKTSGIIFYGNNAVSNMRKIANQLPKNQFNIQTITTDIDVNDIYNELTKCYQQNSTFVPSQIILIEDIDKLYNNTSIAQKLLILLRKGHGVQLYFLCCATNNTMPPELSVNFSVKVEMFYSTIKNGHNAVFDYIGKRQNIKLN